MEKLKEVINMQSNKYIKLIKDQLELKKRKILSNPLLDSLEIDKINAIERALINDRCFLNMNQNVAFNILEYLGFSDEESIEIYNQLSDSSNFEGKFYFYK